MRRRGNESLSAAGAKHGLAGRGRRAEGTGTGTGTGTLAAGHGGTAPGGVRHGRRRESHERERRGGEDALLPRAWDSVGTGGLGRAQALVWLEEGHGSDDHGQATGVEPVSSSGCAAVYGRDRRLFGAGSMVGCVATAGRSQRPRKPCRM